MLRALGGPQSNSMRLVLYAFPTHCLYSLYPWFHSTSALTSFGCSKPLALAILFGILFSETLGCKPLLHNTPRGRWKEQNLNISFTLYGLARKISLLKPQLISTWSDCVEAILWVTLQDYRQAKLFTSQNSHQMETPGIQQHLPTTFQQSALDIYTHFTSNDRLKKKKNIASSIFHILEYSGMLANTDCKITWERLYTFLLQ